MRLEENTTKSEGVRKKENLDNMNRIEEKIKNEDDQRHHRKVEASPIRGRKIKNPSKAKNKGVKKETIAGRKNTGAIGEQPLNGQK